jgi:chromate transporter
VAWLLAKLGTISFGGPAAHIALLEDEVVRRRGWMSHEAFLDLLSVTNLLPGPNALEMAAHIGYLRAGVLGALLASVAFTLPAAAITAVLAWAYVRYGTLPAVQPFLAGIKPVVLVAIVAAAARLAKTALRGWELIALAIVVGGAALAKFDEVVALVIGSVLGAIVLRWTRGSPSDKGGGPSGVAAAVIGGATGLAPAVATSAATVATVSVPLWKLGLFFLKVGAVLYGSGYVLVAYLEGGLVDDYGWLTRQELLDAVAAGQITPGPLITTATFIGYLLGGGPGAALATTAIVLPGFCLVAAVSPWLPRLRRLPWAGRLLDAVGAGSVGLTFAVAIQLAQGTLISPRAWSIPEVHGAACVIALVSAAALWRWKVSVVWLILAGAILGRLLISSA